VFFFIAKTAVCTKLWNGLLHVFQSPFMQELGQLIHYSDQNTGWTTGVRLLAGQNFSLCHV
jgi:hypothetical protein